MVDSYGVIDTCHGRESVCVCKTDPLTWAAADMSIALCRGMLVVSTVVVAKFTFAILVLLCSKTVRMFVICVGLHRIEGALFVAKIKRKVIVVLRNVARNASGLLRNAPCISSLQGNNLLSGRRINNWLWDNSRNTAGE